MFLDWPTLKTLSSMTDDIGVLSLYTTADPHDESSQPAWQKRVRFQLRHLPDQVKAHRSRNEWLAVKARLNSLSSEVDQALDSRTPGIGRALFAAVGNNDAEFVSVQVPLTDHVDLAPMAQLRPLVSAWSAACPAGAVSVSSDEVRVIDIRLGRAEQIRTIPHPEDTADRRDMKGPAHSNPSMAQQTSPLADVFDKREEFRLRRYLHTVGPKIGKIAIERGWDCLAITGDMALANAVAEGLPHGFRPSVALLPHPVSSMSAHKLAALVEPALTRARQQHAQRLTEHARDAALAAKPGPGTIGLESTLAALQQGQVAHLLMAQSGQWNGSRTTHGTLVAGHDAAASNGLVPEPHLDERMIELAFRDGADITIVADDAAWPLGEEGIGAILRWSVS